MPPPCLARGCGFNSPCDGIIFAKIKWEGHVIVLFLQKLNGIIFAKIKWEGQDASQPRPTAPCVRRHAVGGTASPHH